MGKGNAHIDHQAFNLKEHRKMRGIRRFLPIDFSGIDDPDRRLSVLHNPNLDRGGMSSQQEIISDIERIPIIPGGMVARKSQRFEVVKIRFDFRNRDTQTDANHQIDIALNGYKYAMNEGDILNAMKDMK